MLLNPYRFQSGPAGLWTPLNMATVPQLYLDAQDSVVTDVGGFASAISNLGAMGANGDFTTADPGERPAILNGELNGHRVLSFDGANDRMIGNSTAQKGLFKATQSAWCFTVFKKRAATSGVTKVVFYSTTGTGTGERFAAWAGFSGNDNKPSARGRRLDADASGTTQVAPSARHGDYAMVLYEVDYSTRIGRIYVDGVLVVSGTTTASAGPTSNTDSLYPLAIGNFSSGTNGGGDIDLATMVLDRNGFSSGEVDRLFGWAAHKYGLTANLPVGHPYKTTAPTI